MNNATGNIQSQINAINNIHLKTITVSVGTSVYKGSITDLGLDDTTVISCQCKNSTTATGHVTGFYQSTDYLYITFAESVSSSSAKILVLYI